MPVEQQVKSLLASTSGLDLSVLIALLVGVVGVLLLLLRRVFVSKKRRVVICGPMDAGKTALFLHLVGREGDTVTSMEKNEGTIGQNVTLVDVPGHGSRLGLQQAELRRCSRCIVVLDSASAASVTAAARTLFHALQQARVPVLVLLNKNDLPNARDVSLVRRALLREVTSLRDSENSMADLTASSDKKRALPGGELSFEQLQVTLLSASVTRGDIDAVRQFALH
ncbi:MAG: hypothetical protein MHM6MM_004583 [Cercozoa sp. M6MM]